MTRTIHGVVRGKIIAVEEDLGLAEGQAVELTIRAVPPPLMADRQPGEGFLRTEGALADDTEWDGIMEEIYRGRKQERRSPAPDLEGP
jgi:hypothetical protein